MERPSDTRLRGSLAFSIVVACALVVSTMLLPRAPHDTGAAYVQVGVTAVLAASGVFSLWVLLAAVLSVRPALKDPLGRWVWTWTLVATALIGFVGLTIPDKNTLPAVLLYACGLIALFSGVPGLIVAAIPPRAQHDFYGREM